MRATTGERVFSIFNYTILFMGAVVCLFPFIHVLALSLSSESAIISNKVTIFPVEMNTRAYANALGNSSLISSFKFTILLTVLGTIVNLFFTVIGAYPLSKRGLPGKNIVWIYILIAMFISGGLIPTYLVVKALGLINSIWALILPQALSTFNLIVMKTYFQTIPESLEESAKLDGCTDIGVLVKIILPLSIPIIAAMTLFYAVGHWNQFFSALIYINDSKKYTLQLRLRMMIPRDPGSLMLEGDMAEVPRESLKAAAIILSILPIIFVYPWMQKYFIKGMLIGSIKA